MVLSRCRTLEGLSLSTPLTAGVAFDDASVSRFVSAQPTFEQASDAAGEYERQYRLDKLMELFGIDDLVLLADRLQEHYGKLKNIYPDNVSRLHNACNALIDLQGVSEKFKNQLMHLDETAQNERALKGAEYFLSQLSPLLAALKVLLDVEIDSKETSKSVKEHGDALLEALNMKVACLEAVKKHGYRVQTVQRARVDILLNRSRGERPEKEKKKGRERSTSKTAKLAGGDNMNQDLLVALRNWRALKAEELKLPVYIIMKQAALHAIATNMPRTIADLKRQVGIGSKTVERYGAELLDIVNDYDH